jgi:hypothetical protein
MVTFTPLSPIWVKTAGIDVFESETALAKT